MSTPEHTPLTEAEWEHIKPSVLAVLDEWDHGSGGIATAMQGVRLAVDSTLAARTSTATAAQEFVGSVALMDALYETYEAHIGITETEGPDGPYLWCVCGWRSDDLDGNGTKSDSPGRSYALHLVNAQHAAAVKALQRIVIRRTSTPTICTCEVYRDNLADYEPCPAHDESTSTATADTGLRERVEAKIAEWERTGGPSRIAFLVAADELRDLLDATAGTHHRHRSPR